MTDTVDWLEFNVEYSQHDRLTKAMLRQAATEIRRARVEGDHWRRRFSIEQAARGRCRTDANALEAELAMALRKLPRGRTMTAADLYGTPEQNT